MLCFASGNAPDEGWHHDVFECGKLRKKLMELEDEAHVLVAECGTFGVAKLQDIYAVDDNAAAIGLVECSHYLQERGLTGSTCAYNADDFASFDVEVYTF